MPDYLAIPTLGFLEMARFWSSVETISGVSLDNCWNWSALSRPSGYGIFKIAGKRYVATHIVYANVVGPIPRDMKVLHRCDNPKCCNPSHLFLGSQADNVKDMIAKGRQRILRGVDGNSRLTLEQVRQIRSLYKGGGVTQTDLAKQFGISQTNISNIVRGRTWNYIEGHNALPSTVIASSHSR